MKKIYTLSIIFALLGALYSQNNAQIPYISELFNIGYSTTIQANLDTKYYNNIYTIHDSVLFIVNQQGFKNQSGYAKISKINAFTGLEEAYFIPPSPSYMENGGTLGRIWIWALAASDSLLFVAVDEGIWIYRHTAPTQYEYMKSVPIEYISSMELVNNMLHVFVKDDEGFDWLKVNLLNDEIENVRQLVLNNHFFLQIAPVKIISINNNALYFLQRNEPIIEKYSLTGKLLANYRLEIPNWQNIPEEITHKLDSIEDITKRNYAFSKFSIFDNNFMHLFYVFPCERFFMTAIDKKINEEAIMTPYFIQIIGDSTIVEPYSLQLNENDKFEEKYFPFLIPRAEGNLIFTELKEYITQINRTTTVPWLNKTQKEFQNDVNLYYRDNDPIEKIETYNFMKNYVSVDSVQLLDYDDHVFLLNNIKKDKAIFIISQYPQCATCLKVIWNYFSNKTPPNIELYNVTLDCPTYLMKKENIKEVNLYLKTEYVPLFINTKKLNAATKQILAQKTNPIVLLFDKKIQHIEVISSDNIIGDFMGNLKSSFLHRIDDFIEN
jgi:hypothetical protein